MVFFLVLRGAPDSLPDDVGSETRAQVLSGRREHQSNTTEAKAAVVVINLGIRVHFPFGDRSKGS